MKRILVCTGVLGGGTALVFALAAATAMVFPQGTLVASGWNGGGVMFGRAMPEVMPAFGGPVMVDDVVVQMPASIESPVPEAAP